VSGVAPPAFRRRGPTPLAGIAACLVLLYGAAGAARTTRSSPARPAASVRAWVESSADSLDASLSALDRAIGAAETAGEARATERLRAAFRRARTRYKRLEGVVEFYAPTLAASMNSRRQEVDDDDAPPPSTVAPVGFPALEQLLWPAFPLGDTSQARAFVRGMRGTVARTRALGGAIVATDAQLIELARQEVARVSTLGIAGFDTPRSREAMRESADALDGVRAVLDVDGASRWPRLVADRDAASAALASAAAWLRANPDFESSDRLQFIAGPGERAARAIDALRRAASVRAVELHRGWRADAASVYDAGAFDPRAYAAADAPAPTPDLVALGRRLFFEPALSGPGARSCASCHMPSRAFTDGRARQRAIDGRGLVKRHTPTLLNAALAPAQFADERAPTLEEQVVRVLESPAEMGSSIGRAARTLAIRPEYRALFARAFQSPESSSVSPVHLRQALAAFVRSLVALDSRFDRAARGDSAALTIEERRGFTLFMGKAACGTCHFAPLFNGNTPPRYLSSDVEVIGTPVVPSRPAEPDADAGRGGIDHLPLHMRAFKTPTVRNAARTGPYMHHGAFPTLEAVLRFYDGGGGAGAGGKVPNQTLPPDSLHLTRGEVREIIAFLGALTDTIPRRP